MWHSSRIILISQICGYYQAIYSPRKHTVAHTAGPSVLFGVAAAASASRTIQWHIPSVIASQRSGLLLETGRPKIPRPPRTKPLHLAGSTSHGHRCSEAPGALAAAQTSSKCGDASNAGTVCEDFLGKRCRATPACTIV